MAVATLSQTNGEADLDDLLAFDFLLAHPAVLRAFIDLDGDAWPEAARPAANEVESSEEAFLLWKRSLALEAAAPLLGRLLARGLIVWNGSLALAPTDLGGRLADELLRAFPDSERERADRTAREFAALGSLTHDRLRRSLAEELADGK
jgi:hypothetical protein